MKNTKGFSALNMILHTFKIRFIVFQSKFTMSLTMEIIDRILPFFYGLSSPRNLSL